MGKSVYTGKGNVCFDINPLKACNSINGKNARQTQIFHCPPPTGKYKRKARIIDLGLSAFASIKCGSAVTKAAS